MANDSEDLDRTSIEWQVAQAAAEQGTGFDPSVLALTLSLYRASIAFDRSQAGELGPHGMSPAQFNVVTVLHRARRPLSMGEIAAAVSAKPSNLTGIVEALVRRRLLQRELNPSDRRSFLVTTTAEAEAFLHDFLPDHWSYLGEVFDGLTRAERDTLVGLLVRLQHSVERRDLEATAVPPPAVPR